jgi:hypothetical protein
MIEVDGFHWVRLLNGPMGDWAEENTQTSTAPSSHFVLRDAKRERCADGFDRGICGRSTRIASHSIRNRSPTGSKRVDHSSSRRNPRHNFQSAVTHDIVGSPRRVAAKAASSVSCFHESAA